MLCYFDNLSHDVYGDVHLYMVSTAMIAHRLDVFLRRGDRGAIVTFFTYMLITSSMYFINYLFVPHSPATHVV